MIWVRRILTIPFGGILLVLLVVAVVLLQVSDTFLSPKFYRNRLQEVDIYRFVLNDLATAALDEARQLPPSRFDPGLEKNPLVTSGLTTEDLVSALNRALPPAWVQELIEQVLDEPASYITGDRDDFVINLRVGAQVVQVVDEAKTLMRRADAYSLLFERVELEIERALKNELPFGIEVTSERLVESIQRVISREWVEDNVEAVLDAVTSYAVGETESFEIRLELADRVEIAQEEVKSLLRDGDIFDLLYDEVVNPIVADNIGAVFALPFNLEVTQEEVTSALRQVAPRDWVQVQAESIIDAVGRYATKRSDNLEIAIDLRDNKADARQVLVEAARDKVDQIIGGIPDCRTVTQVAQMVAAGLQGIPECLPGGEATRSLVFDAFDRVTGPAERDAARTVALEAFSTVTGGVAGPDAMRLVLEAFDAMFEEVESAVDNLLDQIPDTFVFTSEDLLAALQQAGASANFALLEDIRGIIGDGWTYTDIDLKADLVDLEDDLDGFEAVDLLEDIRSFLADGRAFTEQDLRDGITDFDDSSTLEDFDTSRTWLKRARTFRLLVYVPVVLVLLFIGFLGGRTWRGRVGWAAGYLAVSAAIIFSISGPVYGALVDDGIGELRTRTLAEVEINHDFRHTQELAIDKAIELIEAISDTFASGMANKSALVLALSLVAIGTAIFWPALRGAFSGGREAVARGADAIE